MEVQTREFLYAVAIGTISLVVIAVGYIISLVINQRKFIAKQQASYDQLRELSARIQEVREEERLKIAQEIHDELGQMLTVAKLYLSVLPQHKNGKAPSREVKKRVNAVVKMIDDSINIVKGIAYELRPIVLDDMGVREAIEWEGKNFQAKTGIACTVNSQGDDIHLAKDKAVALFRIFQEAMTNVARHADATRVSVDLTATKTQILMKVSDNGKGIETGAMGKKKSLGIVGMKERAMFLGGELRVAPANGSGTIVTLRIPIMKDDFDGK